MKYLYTTLTFGLAVSASWLNPRKANVHHAVAPRQEGYGSSSATAWPTSSSTSDKDKSSSTPAPPPTYSSPTPTPTTPPVYTTTTDKSESEKTETVTVRDLDGWKATLGLTESGAGYINRKRGRYYHQA